MVPAIDVGADPGAVAPLEHTAGVVGGRAIGIRRA